ncbi:MAG: hypothetical protein ACFFEE_05635 [Candidatus Thorarchaeota archaeon]
MKHLRNTTRVVATVITVMILLSSVQIIVSAQTDLDPVVVLYDFGHENQFAANSVDDGLKLALDMINASTKYELRINLDQRLTDEVLNDVDVLIIADPDESAPFNEDEISGLAEMLANGSSLFLLGDPSIESSSEYWADGPFQDLGENQAMNTLLDNLNITSVRFSINETETAEIFGDTMFDNDKSMFNETYSWMVKLDPTTWDVNHPIFRNINELYTMTATLKPIDLASGIARGYESSFAQYKRSHSSWANYTFPNMTLAEFEQNPLSYSAINGTYPTWMSAFEFGSSRIVISGSALMFSGKNLDYPETDLRWVFMGDNARLFMNIIDWLSEDFILAPSAILQLAVISSVVLVIGTIFYLFKKLR